nr:uncharacterized protein LOC111413321 [Onthophagus taurus]
MTLSPSISFLFIISMGFTLCFDKILPNSLKGKYCITTFGEYGLCTLSSDCPAFYTFLKKPHFCGLEGLKPLICCVQKIPSTSPPTQGKPEMEVHIQKFTSN